MSDNVLFVDDEVDFLQTLSERMSLRGVAPTTTSSPKEAIELAKKENFDAIVLDLLMPEMDGLEVLQALKEIRPEVQVILLTGRATVEKGITAMKLGALDFMEKPADIETLMEKIKRAKANKLILVEKKNDEMIQKILKERGW
jgi:DNA-binding NtrC family response regulator